MKLVILIAISTIFTAYGFSTGVSLPFYAGYFIGWSGAICSIVAAYLQYRHSQPYEHLFKESDWINHGDYYEINIPDKLHKKGYEATSTIYQKNIGGYEEVICCNHLQADKSVSIKANLKFEGKVTIK